jgi:hypothetical protein
MRPLSSRFRRFAGYAFIALIWSGLAALLAFFGVVFALYSDFKNPTGSRLTAGTAAEFVGGAIYNWFRSASPSLPDAELVYVPHPGAVRIVAPEYDVVMTVARDGTRQQPPRETPAAGGLVVVAGDSFTFGLGVQDHETYAAVLQQKFGYATVNTGVISYGTARELWRLRRMGLLSKADALVIQFCSNDGRENADFVRDPSGRFGRDQATQIGVAAEDVRYMAVTYGNVLGATLRYLRGRAAGEGYWGAIKAIARSRRASLGAVARARDRRSGEALAADFLGVLDQFPELAGKPIYVLELNDRGGNAGFLEALAQKVAGRPNVKPVPVRLTEDQFFRFDGHLTPRGHETVAAALDRALRER